MNDNEYYIGKVERYDSKEKSGEDTDEFRRAGSKNNETNDHRSVSDKKHSRRKRMLQLLCSAAMIVVVSNAALGDETGEGPLPGRIMNSKTGEGIENVSLAFYRGNVTSGNVIATAVTDSDGNFSVSLEDGEYIANATAKGFLTEGLHFYADNAAQTMLTGTLLPLSTGKEYTIVLTWGDHPNDLDSHVECDLNERGLFDYSGYLHVFYSHRDYYTSPEYVLCNLDVDDTNCYGPETITLETTGNNPFYYYVHDYSGTGDMYSSQAIVRVYKGSKLLKTFYVPDEESGYRYWNVFAIYKDKIIANDTMSETPDLQYADKKDKNGRIDEY